MLISYEFFLYYAKISYLPVWPNDVISTHVFSLLEDKQKSKLGGVMRAIKYDELHMLLLYLEAFRIVFKHVLSIFHVFHWRPAI